MDEHNDRFTEEHARQLTEPSEQEWQRQRWLSYYSGPRITVEGLCDLPPSMHYVCNPAHDTGGAWTLNLRNAPHPFAPHVLTCVRCQFNTEGPLENYPALCCLVQEGRRGTWQPRTLRIAGCATVEELFDEPTPGRSVARRSFTMGAEANGIEVLDET
jgi:hypothetical protein